MDRYARLVDQLLARLQPGFGGRDRPEFIAEIAALTGDLEDLAPRDSYVRQRTSGVREWVEVACTGRRYAVWGLSVVDDFALSNALRLRREPLQRAS